MQPMKHDPNDPTILDTLAQMVRARHTAAVTRTPCAVCSRWRLREGEVWLDNMHASTCGMRGADR